MKFIQSGFRFKTRVGKGRGVVRLANVGPEEWRAWTVYTVLERLDGQDEVEARREKEQSTLSSSSGAVLASTRGEGDVQVLVIGVGELPTGNISWLSVTTNCTTTRPLRPRPRRTPATPRAKLPCRRQDFPSWRLVAKPLRNNQIAHAQLHRPLRLLEIPNQLAALPQSGPDRELDGALRGYHGAQDPA